MRLCSLGSGSLGNATLIECGSTRILLDCGYSLTVLEQRLRLNSADPANIDAVLLTHEHSDHSRGLKAFIRRYTKPLWATPGTLRHFDWCDSTEVNKIRLAAPRFRIGDCEVTAYAVPHDAAEPCQFVFHAQTGRRLAVLTDIGTVTAHMRQILDGLDGIFLECNHDLKMLQRGPYPTYLKARIAGAYGHLSNRQAAELLVDLASERLQFVAAAHISATNNHPQLVVRELEQCLSTRNTEIYLLEQSQPSPWFALV